VEPVKPVKEPVDKSLELMYKDRAEKFAEILKNELANPMYKFEYKLLEPPNELMNGSVEYKEYEESVEYKESVRDLDNESVERKINELIGVISVNSDKNISGVFRIVPEATKLNKFFHDYIINDYNLRSDVKKSHEAVTHDDIILISATIKRTLARLETPLSCSLKEIYEIVEPEEKKVIESSLGEYYEKYGSTGRFIVEPLGREELLKMKKVWNESILEKIRDKARENKTYEVMKNLWKLLIKLSFSETSGGTTGLHALFIAIGPSLFPKIDISEGVIKIAKESMDNTMFAMIFAVCESYEDIDPCLICYY